MAVKIEGIKIIKEEEILSIHGLKLLIWRGWPIKITLIPSDFNLLEIFISFSFELFSNTKTFFPSDLRSFAALIPEFPSPSTICIWFDWFCFDNLI